MSTPTPFSRFSVDSVRQKFAAGEKIVVLTAYDFPFAALADDAGVDILLVGDSLGCVVQGHDSTLPVTLDEMIYHSRMVCRAAKRAMVVVDMPFMSYQLGPKEALAAAGRIIKETGANAVKLEGGQSVAEQIRAIVEAGIPVMGHVGLTPQSVNQFGGYKVQGKTNSRAAEIEADAVAVQESGAFSVVLEGIPNDLASSLAAKLTIPTIGIGASHSCAGQVLVIYDALGLFPPGTTRVPKFVKRYAQLGEQISKAIVEYVSDVRTGKFPAEEHTYGSRN